MSIKALTKIRESAKASVVVAVIALATIALYLNRITAEQYMGLLEWLMPGWLAAHAVERSAEHLAKKTPPTADEEE